MNNLLDQVFGILNSPQGSLVYHLILTFSLAAALQVLLIANRATRFVEIERPILGLSVLLLLQILIFISSGFALQGAINGRSFLPIFDRAIGAYSLVFVIWMWGFPQKSRLGDNISTAVCIVIAAFIAFSLFIWSRQAPSLSFNGTEIELGWNILSIFIAVTGIFVLLIERGELWGVGLAMIDIIIIGYIFQLAAGQAGIDFAPPVRLTLICAYPLLPSLAQRLHRSVENESPVSSMPAPVTLETKNQPTADPKTVQAWLEVALHRDSPTVLVNMARAIAQTMRADKCYLVSTPTPEGFVLLLSGYDLTHEQELPKGLLETERIPKLAEFLDRGEPILLSPRHPEHQYLREIAGIEACDILITPLTSTHQPWGAAMLLAPYSRRQWDMEDEEYLSPAVEDIVAILQHTSASPVPSKEPTAAGFDSAAIKEAGDQIERLKAQNTALQQELSRQTRPPGEVIEPYATRLHQTLAGIAAYCNVLLSETTGILGSVQKNNLEKILDSSAQVQSVVDGISAGVSPESLKVPVPGDIATAFDGAVANYNNLLRKKRITLQIDLPEKMPHLRVNQDILQQMLACLLENTIHEATEKGVVVLRSYLDTTPAQFPHLLLQVAGAASRSAVNSLPDISTYANMSLQKAVPADFAPTRVLAEAYEGALWVEEAPGGILMSTLMLPIKN